MHSDVFAVQMLQVVARALGPLLDKVVFVGGSILGLLVTDRAARSPRPTHDVDVVTIMANYSEFSRLEEKLRELGFKHDLENDAPICRWVIADIRVDVMPSDEGILGFSNKWYDTTFETAQGIQLTNELYIRIATAPCLVAMKLDAFNSRGKGDFMSSKDIEDIIYIISGRQELYDEVNVSPCAVRDYITIQIKELLSNNHFVDSIPGHLADDPTQEGIVMQRLERLSRLASK